MRVACGARRGWRDRYVELGQEKLRMRIEEIALVCPGWGTPREVGGDARPPDVSWRRNETFSTSFIRK